MREMKGEEGRVLGRGWRLVGRGGKGGGGGVHDQQIALLETGSYAADQGQKRHDATDDDKNNGRESGQITQVLSVFGVDACGVEIENVHLIIGFDDCPCRNEQAANGEKTC